MQYSTWFKEPSVVMEIMSANPATKELLEHLSQHTVRSGIEMLIVQHRHQPQQPNIILSHLFFLLSELTAINPAVSDFCLDSANYLALDVESRVEKFDIEAAFEDVKALAEVHLPAPEKAL